MSLSLINMITLGMGVKYMYKTSFSDLYLCILNTFVEYRVYNEAFLEGKEDVFGYGVFGEYHLAGIG